MKWKSKKHTIVNDNNISKIEKNSPGEIQEFTPKNYKEIQPMANAMILQKPIKIDLSTTIEEDRRRIIDFLCGISYVVGFVVDKVKDNVYEFRGG